MAVKAPMKEYPIIGKCTVVLVNNRVMALSNLRVQVWNLKVKEDHDIKVNKFNLTSTGDHQNV